MANQQSQKKTRRLRQAPQTMRERAASAQKPQTKPNRVRKAAHAAGTPFRAVRRTLARLPIWKPFGVIGRFLGRILLPRYVRNSFKELRMVTWPTRRQTLQLTTAVILFSVIFGVVVALFDFGLDKLFKQVILR